MAIRSYTDQAAYDAAVKSTIESQVSMRSPPTLPLAMWYS